MRQWMVLLLTVNQKRSLSLMQRSSIISIYLLVQIAEHSSHCPSYQNMKGDHCEKVFTYWIRCIIKR